MADGNARVVGALMLKLENLSFDFPGTNKPVIRLDSLRLASGELAILTGHSGSGKSTLLKCLNGLAPHFTSGTLRGLIEIDGRQLGGCLPHDFAHLVGYVSQQPEVGFVAQTVAEEIAFGMEQLGQDSEKMWERVHQAAELVGVSHLVTRNLETLSGGQQQAVAIAAAIGAGAQILLLDEPTSELDEPSAQKLIETLKRLKLRGYSIIVAEHRLDPLVDLADSYITIDENGLVRQTENVEAIERFRLKAGTENLSGPSSGEVVLCARNVSVQLGGKEVVEPTNLDVHAGEVVTLVGNNGSGKSSLLWALQSSLSHAGEVTLAGGQSLTNISASQLRNLIALVPQVATDLLMATTVAAELKHSDASANLPVDTTLELLEKLMPGIDLQLHPRNLSAGQQLALVLAIQLSSGAKAILLDEPTRGLDARSKVQLIQILQSLKAQGHGLLVATHDRHFAQLLGDRSLVMANGQVNTQ